MSVVVALCVCIVLCTEMRTSNIGHLPCMYTVLCSMEKTGKFVPSDILCQAGWWKMLCGNWISYVAYSVLVSGI